MQGFALYPFDPPGDIVALRADLRRWLAANQPQDDVVARANCWASFDPDFSRLLGAAGYIGMTLPGRYGGGDRHPLERYVVIEELLAAGAPVGAHWIADRQTGPLILRYGSEEQRQRHLPGIAKGELYACIGLSEPGAGSDLAAVRTSARETAEGWRINGQKIWTTGAHFSHIMLALVRTEEGSERNAGLSQLLIDLDTPGITIRPIIDMAGHHDFNEVFFDDVLVPHGALVGEPGQGWKQVTAELGLERSGPERYLSSHALFVALIDSAGPAPAPAIAGLIGELTAEMWTLRQLSMSTAAKLAAGEDPMVEASVVKELGNAFEQDMPRRVQAIVDCGWDDEDDLAKLLRALLIASPSFSLRGGTREVIRGIIARGLGLR
ncbi:MULTISPECIES: acyl-CoA dehydrogenase family protein [unclassified Sphingopyxis]|jgi:alkylation response protein AidB-like acyl-CoA dehydrogenase|uniref:acyl-CoA dehydrogenase family protein n=1 Tax=unclassified Sphingopyxis TaxID=2614943 RepID=UPI0006C4ED79|nr:MULTISPECIES: acyl-CoA dehydrogenase family protein [unclassified Sphingopyxis]USI78930.1 acyl-CoA dehydrogenase family protein [Sphingopyxis sp. USTB-05]GAO78617.1 butyryl-CoA dehydrogenase [Sphingopyxis sp. C-1]